MDGEEVEVIMPASYASANLPILLQIAAWSYTTTDKYVQAFQKHLNEPKQMPQP